ncbi:hypothetical protein H8F21_16835 [Pseudomonas sp. P66]|uniref:SlyX protein n=1 Tax=Pseudomonas arcuscaelestis TaxID=2710591 RepID=A0ABS2C051_9PSED|nr:hypothetical protein [Pseudomonas arcuscaelestis]MBM5459234.1 hypothetical protein [Pseudomonas arcuscaelestis]
MSMRQVSLLERMLAEQVKQTELLQQIAKNQAVLIQALGEDQGLDDDGPPPTYLSGQPCR